MGQSVLIHARFEAAARRRPDALAVAAPEGELTYAELERLSRRFAAELLAAGAGPGRVVAILAERGPRAVVAALACSRAGAPFVILDLAYPPERLAALADVCRPKLQLLAAETAGLAGCGPAIAIDLDAAAPAPDVALPDVSPDAPAYLLFTSGSTGAPKCVACSHRPLVNFVDWQARTFDLGAGDRFTLLSGLSHDPVLRDVFTPLSLGASLHIPAQATLTEPGALAAWFAKVRPTAAHMTPPLGHLLTAGRAAEHLHDLRYVFWGGDVLRRGHVEALAALAPNAESVNFYGATETPQAASYFRVPRGFAEDRAPIGAGIDGFALEIRDDDARRVAGETAGEIVVRSRFLTLGPVRDGALPRGRAVEEGYYATGDIGHRRADGQIAIQGRRDDQVKIRGYRVELTEVTACMTGAPGVAQAVTLNVGEAGEARLCAFVEGPGADPDAVRAHLAARLPAHMVPGEIVRLPKLPLLANGKIDRQALIASRRSPAAPAPVATLAKTPLGKVEAALVASWQPFFGRQTVTPSSTFAGLGGDSLSYVSAYLSLEEALGEVPDHWTTMTIAELAATARPAGARSAFVTIESAILMRAVAISVVVGSHFGLFFSGGAGTGALLWVSGSIFGGLQLREMDHDGRLAPIGRLLKSILIPLYLIELPQFLAKLALHAHARLSSVLLTTDLLDYTGLPSAGPDAYGGNEYLLWYIHAVVHILIAYAALMLVCKYVLRLRRPATAAALAAVALGLAGRFLLPALFQPGFWSQPVDPMSYFNHAPTTHLATFALAALAGLIGSRWRWAILGVTLVYVAASAPIYGLADSAPIAAIAAVLAFAPKLSVPRFLSTPIYMVAGASFFIYLLQFKFWVVFTHLHLPALVAWPGAVAGGVAVWAGWNWFSQRAGRWLAALRAPRRGWRLAGQGA
jgi:amino acid adenylation domain-containing protein